MFLCLFMSCTWQAVHLKEYEGDSKNANEGSRFVRWFPLQHSLDSHVLDLQGKLLGSAEC